MNFQILCRCSICYEYSYISEVYASAEKKRKRNLNALDETTNQDKSFIVLTCSVSISYEAPGDRFI